MPETVLGNDVLYRYVGHTKSSILGGRSPMTQQELFPYLLYNTESINQSLKNDGNAMSNEDIRQFHEEIFETVHKKKSTPYLIDTGRRTTTESGSEKILWRIVK